MQKAKMMSQSEMHRTLQEDPSLPLDSSQVQHRTNYVSSLSQGKTKAYNEERDVHKSIRNAVLPKRGRKMMDDLYATIGNEIISKKPIVKPKKGYHVFFRAFLELIKWLSTPQGY